MWKIHTHPDVWGKAAQGQIYAAVSVRFQAYAKMAVCRTVRSDGTGGKVLPWRLQETVAERD